MVMFRFLESGWYRIKLDGVKVGCIVYDHTIFVYPWRATTLVKTKRRYFCG